MRTFESHTSVKLSKENCPQTNEFNFCKIEEKDVKSFRRGKERSVIIS